MQLETFTVVIEECPDYSIDIETVTEEHAIKAARALYRARGRDHFLRNGRKTTDAKVHIESTLEEMKS